MVSFTHESAYIFGKLLNMVRVLNPEATMGIHEDGIYFWLMDPGHVSAIHLKIPGEVESEDREPLPLDLSELYPALFEQMEPDDGYKLKVEYSSDKSRWTLTSPSAPMRKYVFDTTKPLIEEPPERKYTLTTEVTLVTRDLLKELRIFNSLYDHVTLWTEYNGARNFTLYAEGDLKGSYRKAVFDEEHPLVDTVSIEHVGVPDTTTYTVAYLHDYVEALLEMFPMITLSWKEDYPLSIKGKQTDLYNRDIEVEYRIAPCVGVHKEARRNKK